MTSTIILVLAIILISGCKAGPKLGLDSPVTPTHENDQNPLPTNFAGSWNGFGSTSVTSNTNSTMNCEKANLEIRKLSLTQYSFVDHFSCARGRTIITNLNVTLDIRNQNVYLQGQRVGNFSAGYLDVSYVQNQTTIRWTLAITPNRINYSQSTELNGTTTSAQADLAQ